MADGETMKKINEGFKTLQAGAECKSLLKKHLTEGVKNKLKDKKTKLGASLWDVIQSGVKNLDSGVGLYVPDAEAYTLYKDLFDPVIQEYHLGFKPTDRQPPVDLGEGKIGELKDLDPENKFIEAIKIRCARSMASYPFNPCLNEANYKEMEAKMKGILQTISNPELQGTYYPLTHRHVERSAEPADYGPLFVQGRRQVIFLEFSMKIMNACHFWLIGRGIFHNKNKTFLVWVKEEDNLRFISRQVGGNVGTVLDRLIRGIKAIEWKVQFNRDDHLGWLTFCPTNLGSTIRASAYLKIPNVLARPDFKKLCEDMKLQPRGIHGEHSQVGVKVVDVANRVRLGVTEYTAVKMMYDGVKKLIELEMEAISATRMPPADNQSAQALSQKGANI